MSENSNGSSESAPGRLRWGLGRNCDFWAAGMMDVVVGVSGRSQIWETFVIVARILEPKVQNLYVISQEAIAKCIVVVGWLLAYFMGLLAVKYLGLIVHISYIYIC